MITIAVLSDIHGNLPALEAVAADIKLRGIETVLNLGDHLSGPLWPLETLRFLQKTDWIHLRGNHDRQLLEGIPEQMGLSDRYAFQFLSRADLDWLGSLPSSLILNDQISLFHGRPQVDDLYLLDSIEGDQIRSATQREIVDRLGATRTPLVLCGHSHTPRVVELPEGRLAVNPGSVGLQAYSDDVPQPHRVEVGTPQARYALLVRTVQGWAAESILIKYDFQAAAEQARMNGRPEWARALLTGSVL
jgi:predicted phosphodiesterase